MKTNRLFCIPRALTVMFILFISLFSLDAFSGNGTFSQKLGGFLIHLIPSYGLIIALIISWRKPLIGGFVFILLGIIFTFYFKTYCILSHFLIISLPIFVLGALFIVLGKLES